MGYRKCQTAEAAVGMLYYMSDIAGTGGRLKEQAEDFVVDEISCPPERAESGRFTIATVQVRNWETNRMVWMLSRQLGISRERIGFAGTKDKRAVTTQLMSFQMPSENLERIHLQDMTVTNPYPARRPVRIGDLIGNRFRIRVTHCTAVPADIPGIFETVRSEVAAVGGFPNYFGVQRFGVVRPITHIMGELIVRGDLEGAVRCYLSAPAVVEGPEAAAARKELATRSDWKELIRLMPPAMDFEKALVSHLIEEPDDWAGAIGCLPTNLQMMFVHAYQSYLFNLMLSERIRCGLPLNRPVVGDIVVPLDADRVPIHDDQVLTTAANIDLVERQVKLGKAYVTAALYGSTGRFAEGEMGEIERAVIAREHLEPEDFVVPELPHCTSEGSRREIVCPVRDLTCAAEPDTDNYTVSFSLPKGNYATCLMREFMKSDMGDY